MARRVKTVTAKSGLTADDRRVLAAVSATTAAPTRSTDGFLVQQNEYLHILFALSGTNPVFRLRIYWYSDVSGRWHKGQQLVINGDDSALVEVQGMNRIALSVEAVVGTSPTLDAWIALARPV